MKTVLLSALMMVLVSSAFAQFDRPYKIEILQQSDEYKVTMQHNLISFQSPFKVTEFKDAYDSLYSKEFLVLMTDEKDAADLIVDYKNMSVVLNARLSPKEREYALTYALLEVSGNTVYQISDIEIHY